MLTWDEEDFLSKISNTKLVTIRPFDPVVSKTSLDLVNELRHAVPELEVRHMGASALGISGQNDIDVYVFCKPEEFGKYTSRLTEIFGEPKNQKHDSIAWKLQRQSLDVEVYLTDPTSEPMKRQIAVFIKLETNRELAKEYERLKESFNGKPFKEYQRAKYEFYHRLLGE